MYSASLKKSWLIQEVINNIGNLWFTSKINTYSKNTGFVYKCWVDSKKIWKVSHFLLLRNSLFLQSSGPDGSKHPICVASSSPALWFKLTWAHYVLATCRILPKTYPHLFELETWPLAITTNAFAVAFSSDTWYQTLQIWSLCLLVHIICQSNVASIIPKDYEAPEYY